MEEQVVLSIYGVPTPANFPSETSIVVNKLTGKGYTLSTSGTVVELSGFNSATLSSSSWAYKNITGTDSAVNLPINLANLVIPKGSAFGVKVDTSSATFPWRDILGDVSPKFTGANSPTLAAFRGGVWRGWFHAAGDLTFCTFHIPHDYVLGTDLHLHLHWAHNGTAISGQLVVTYGITYAKGHNQATNGNFIAEIAPVLTVSTPDIATIPQYRHRVDEIQISAVSPTATQLNSSIIEPDGLLLVAATTTTIPSITGGTTNKPCFFTLDLHYQSSNIGTKNRAPDFYT